MTDVFKNLKSSNDSLLSNPYDLGSDMPSFFEHPFYLQKNRLSTLLLSLGEKFNSGISGQLKFNIEFFFDTAGALLISQQETLKQIKAINSIKFSTKKELYKRVLIATDYIQSNWKNKISIFDLASVAALSPYHFHRVFKSIYNETPSRFIRNIKLEHAQRATQILWACYF